MKMGRVALESTRDTVALRNRRPPNMSYRRQGQEQCHSEFRSDCTCTMGEHFAHILRLIPF